jgi:hypothetical protein
VLLFFAVIYAKERVIYTDSGNYLFFIIQSKTFFVAHHRFISLLFEIPVVIGVKNHFSLPGITLLYSLGYLIPELIVAIILFLLKDYSKVIALVLLLIVGNNYDFFYTASEFHKGIYFCLLFWSCLEKYVLSRKKFYAGSIFFLCIVIVWSHPLTIFPLSFIVAYVYLKKRKDNVSLYKRIAVGIFLLILFKLLVFPSGHEKAKYSFIKGLIKYFPYLNHQLSRTFFGYLVAHQLSFLGLIVVNLIVLLKNRNRQIAILFSAFFGGYWILVTASFSTYSYDYYIEHLYKPLVFFTVAIFCKDVLPLLRREFVMPVLIVIAVYGILKINHTSKFFARRQESMERIMNIMEDHHIQKAYMQGQNYKGMLNDDRWNSSVISLLLSSYNDRKKTKTVDIEYGCDKVTQDINNDSTNFYLGYKIKISDLNPDYYRLSSNNLYVKIDSFLPVN